MMTLTPEDEARTSRELRANWTLSGVNAADAARDLEITVAQFWAALDCRTTPIETLWAVRDYLWDMVLAGGGRPVRYTVLTESARQVAAMWHPLSPQSHRHRGL
jgi:hypothetical protein